MTLKIAHDKPIGGNMRVGVNIRSVIVVQPSKVVHIRAGYRGAGGQDGAMSDADVISVIDSHLTSIPSTDAINVNNGRVSVTVDALQQI